MHGTSSSRWPSTWPVPTSVGNVGSSLLRALADRPRSVLVRTTQARRLAGDLLASEAVQGVSVDGDQLVISSSHAGDLAELLPFLPTAPAPEDAA